MATSLTINKIKKNWPAIFLAFLVALSVGFPEILFMFELGDKYQGVPLAGTDAETHYLVRMKEAYDGYYKVSNAYSEPKNLPYIYPAAGEALVGTMSRAIGVSVVSANIAMKFIAPFIIFLLIYYLVLSTSKSKEAALLSAAFIVLGSNLIARPAEILGLFSSGNISYHPGFNNYFRPINPGISSILLFSYLAFFYNFLKNPKTVYATLLGVILGASFYFYLFTWTFLLVFSFSFLFLFLLEKKYGLFRKNLILLGVAFLASIPYWVNTFNVYKHSSYAEASLRFGLQSGHAPFLSGSLVLFLVVSVFFVAMRRFNWIKSKDTLIFVAVSMLSVVVVYNQQIITGKTIQSSHYHFMITIPIVAALLVVSLWLAAQKMEIFKKHFLKYSFGFFILIILLVNNFNWQFFSYMRAKQTATERQDYMGVIKWLKDGVKKDEIIFSDIAFSELIPIFTRFDIYPSGYAQYYLVNNDVFKKHVFLELKFSGLTPPEAREKFLKELRNKISYAVYAVRYRNNLPDEEALKLAEEYDSFSNKNLKELLSEDYYKPTYFIFDQKFNELALPESEIKNVMEKVADISGRFLIYKIK